MNNSTNKKNPPNLSVNFRNFAYDNQIRNDLAELYQIMYGLNRPNCLPTLNEVIHVQNKAKKIMPFFFCIQTNELSMKDELDDVSDAIVDIDPVNKFLFKK